MLEELGREMRARREARGLSLRDVQAELKIRSRYLEAMESGDYGVFPGDIYARGFLRSYVRFLGMDERQALESYRQALPAAEPAAPLQRVVLGKLTVSQADDGGAPYAPERVASAYRAGRGAGAAGWIFGGLSVAALAAVILYFIGSPRLRPPGGAPGAGSAPVAAPARNGLTASAAPAPSRTEPAPAPAPKPEPQFRRLPASPQRPDLLAYEVTLPQGTDVMTIEIATGARCWYSVTADGQEVTQGTLDANQRAMWQGLGEVSIRLGNPADVRWSVNGKAGDAVRESNPITLQLTRKR